MNRSSLFWITYAAIISVVIISGAYLVHLSTVERENAEAICKSNGYDKAVSIKESSSLIVTVAGVEFVKCSQLVMEQYLDGHNEMKERFNYFPYVKESV